MNGQPVPSSVTVFGILHTAFGAFGLATSPLNFVNLGRSLQLFRSIGVSPLFLNWLKVSLYLSPIYALILIVLGIGLLRKQPWGRSGSVIYAYFNIAITILAVIMTVVGLAGGATSGRPEAIGGLIGGVIGGLFGLIYPILTLVFLNQESVKVALERRNDREP